MRATMEQPMQSIKIKMQMEEAKMAPVVSMIRWSIKTMVSFNINLPGRGRGRGKMTHEKLCEPVAAAKMESIYRDEVFERFIDKVMILLSITNIKFNWQNCCSIIIISLSWLLILLYSVWRCNVDTEDDERINSWPA